MVCDQQEHDESFRTQPNGSIQNRSAEGEPECRALHQGKWKNGRKKKGDRSRGLGMWEVRCGGVRNYSGFWVESLQLSVMPLKEKKGRRGKTGLGRKDAGEFLRYCL